MASTSSIDPNSGYLSATSTFHSLRTTVLLPPPYVSLSFPSYVLSLLPSPLPTSPALVNAATNTSLSFPSFLSQLNNLSTSLQAHLQLSRGDVAFILSPSRLDLPILYFSLLSLGVSISPANPASTPGELTRLFALVNPTVAFATSSTAPKLPSNIPTILLDSPEFSSFLSTSTPPEPPKKLRYPNINQADTAIIQFSSGTTGSVKAAALSHRNLIALLACIRANSLPAVAQKTHVSMMTAPMFHSMGFGAVVARLAMGDTTVVMDRPGFSEMLGAIQQYRVTSVGAAPPVVVAMGRSEELSRFDLGTLEEVICGGAPLPVADMVRFKERFPTVVLRLGYGATEAGAISIMINNEECCQMSSVGRLNQNFEAKIVDTDTAKPLSVGQHGELWLRGPTIMKGYLSDEEANASTFEPDGWLKTGDLCYFDDNGFLYIVDRLKELIKYKAYQVSPAELEQVLHCLPDVMDAAVIPYPKEDVGQIPMALVVRRPGSNLDEAHIINHVAKQVAPYKKIRKVVFVNTIPKSPAGKILRRELTRYALSGVLMPKL